MHSPLRRPAVALVTITLAASVLGIAPAAHAADAVISGTVTGNGAALEGVEVGLYTYVAQYQYWEWASLDDQTDSSGAYSITAPEGQYRIGFEDYSGDFVGEYYDNAEYVDSADADTVTSSAATPVVANADLAVGGHITGTVSGPSPTGPLQGIRVIGYKAVLDEDGDLYYDYAGAVRTDADGFYDIYGLGAGTYRVEFDDNIATEHTYATEYYDDEPSLEGAATKDLTLPSAGLVENINAQLELDSEITGTVTGAGPNGTAPVINGDVDVLTKVGNRWEYVGYDTTDSSGNYRVDGLPAGTYRVRFNGDLTGGYAFEFWNNVGLLGNAENVILGENVTVPGINSQLVVDEHDAEVGPRFVNTALPTISGGAVVGQTLTATTGSWATSDSGSGTPTRFYYEWYRDGDYIDGAYASTYIPTALDVGKKITVAVDAEAERSGYGYGYAESAPTQPVLATAPVVTPPVVTPPVVTPPVVTPPAPAVDLPTALAKALAALKISGKPKVGKTVKVANLDLDLRTAVTYKFQWYAGTKKIKKATKSKLKVTSAMKGKKLSVKVTGTASSTTKSVKLKVGKVS